MKISYFFQIISEFSIEISEIFFCIERINIKITAIHLEKYRHYVEKGKRLILISNKMLIFV